MLDTQTASNRVSNGVKAVRKWIIPYFGTRLHSSEFRPILSYLFTEWDCNMRCHYCYTWEKGAPGMTLETARSSIDWLRSTGCRVFGFMGGEPLLRPDFVEQVVRYGTEQGFFVYLPTNGLAVTEDIVDRLGAAGISAINLAMDCIEPRPGMPKALKTIERQFRILVDRQRRHGYVLFLNINITSHNIEDVRQLTHIAADLGIGVDYHINERPHIEQSHYQYLDNDTYIRQDQWEVVDELIDWLIERNHKVQPMVNTVAHLQAMKAFYRDEIGDWSCRAGQNTVCIRIDGSLSPCFGLYSAKHDWGRIWDPRFDPEELQSRKKKCTRACLSTCQYNAGVFYRDTLASVSHWVWVHAAAGGGDHHNNLTPLERSQP